MSRYTLHAGDCRDVIREYPADHFDSIVTDPPYGLSFMGKGWDKGVPGEEFWREALRVAKPGAHLLAFGGTRTFHRMAVAIEDAGWEIRDCLMWVYASGFPKSYDVSKAIDKAASAEREVIGSYIVGGTAAKGKHKGRVTASADEGSATGATKVLQITAAATDAARQWQGWGTALKPAWEPILLARKPLVGTIAENVLKHGTGAINIDGCRVEWADTKDAAAAAVGASRFVKSRANGTVIQSVSLGKESRGGTNTHDLNAPGLSFGRWPANVIHDGSEEALAGFPSVAGESAARFFYCAKASRADREEGCDHLPARTGAEAVDRDEDTAGLQSPRAGAGRTADAIRNFHPTVKPTELMRYLIRLITPPDSTVLDPFMGSGSTGKAAMLEGFRFVGIDLDPDHVAIAEARCEHASAVAPAPPALNGSTSILTAPAPRATATATAKTAPAQLSLLDALDAL